MLDPGKQGRLVCQAPLDSCQVALFSTPIYTLMLSMVVTAAFSWNINCTGNGSTGVALQKITC